MEIYLSDLITICVAVSAVLASVIQIAPIKINPWSALFRWIGIRLTKDIRDEVSDMKQTVSKIETDLAEHIKVSDQRKADDYRQRILVFNTELLRDIPHTKEDYNDILLMIDKYKKYCNAHPDYENQRAKHATKHIEEMYDEHLRKHDFLQN